MYAFVTKLLLSRQLEFGQGQISLLGQPITILPATFIEVLMRQAMRSRKDMVRIYMEAWKAGYVFMHNVVTRYGLNTPEERYRVAMDTITMAGMGDYKTEEFVPHSHTRFKVLRNPLALSFHPSTRAIDHVLKGFNAGGGTPVHFRIMNCIELECAAMNGSYCRFVNACRSELERMDSGLVEEQLELDKMIEEQLRFIRGFGYTLEV